MNKVIKVLPLVLFVVLLVGCALPAADPFAALSANVPQIATGAPGTNATAQNTTTPPLSTIEPCTVTANKALNMRSDAGTFAPVVVVLSRGDVLTVHNDRGAWWDVSTVEGYRGYINSKYCSK